MAKKNTKSPAPVASGIEKAKEAYAKYCKDSSRVAALRRASRENDVDRADLEQALSD